jgi:orotate phosphoribosyltransferase
VREVATPLRDELVGLLSGRKGHFLLESGHHGDWWLDLEVLCLRPEPIRRFAAELAKRLAPYRIDAVCGPLVEGAFVALMVASALDVEFTYAERFAHPGADGLFTVEYRLPAALRDRVRGRRIAIVNDVISAGSAVRGTFADLQACGAEIVAIGALLVLGDSFAPFAAEQAVPLETLVSLPYGLWTPAECPLCAAGVQLEDVG